MNEKLNRIAEFIESLPMDSENAVCQSTILSTDMEAVGGDNGGNCINTVKEQCSKVKNGGDCKNYNRACDKSDNSGNCLSTDLKYETDKNPSMGG